MAEKDDFKQVPLRLKKANWRALQLAKVNSGRPMQKMLFEALSDYLRKHKLGTLEPQEDDR